MDQPVYIFKDRVELEVVVRVQIRPDGSSTVSVSPCPNTEKQKAAFISGLESAASLIAPLRFKQ